MTWSWQKGIGRLIRRRSQGSSGRTPAPDARSALRWLGTACREAVGIDLRWVRRRLPMAVAAAALLVMFWSTRQPPDLAEATQLKRLTEQLISSSNHGHYFQLKNLDSPAQGITIRLPRVDIGMFYFPSLAIYLQKTLRGPDFQADIWMLYDLQFLAFLAAILICSLPGVDVRIFLAAVAAMGLGFLDGFLTVSFYGYWAPALAVWMTIVFLISLNDRIGAKARSHLLLALACGAQVGILAMWRGDAGHISMATAAIYSAFLIGHLIIARLLPSLREERAALARRKVLLVHLAVFFAGAQLPHWLADAHLWLHQQSAGIRHFSPGVSLGHPVWHPLYLGLSWGRPDNQFGIQWKDSVAYLHVKAEDRTIAYLSEDYERELRRLYFRTVLLEPRLLLDTLLVNARKLHGNVGLVAWILFGAALLATYRLADGNASIQPCGYGFVCLLASFGASLAPPLLILAEPHFSVAFKMALWMSPLIAVACITAPARTGLCQESLQAPRSLNSMTAFVAAAVALLLLAFCLLIPYSDARKRAFLDEMASADRLRLEEMARDEGERFRVGLSTMPPSQRDEFVQTFAGRTGPVTGGGSLHNFEESDLPFEVSNVTLLNRWFLLVLKSSRPSVEKGQLAVHAYPNEDSKQELAPDRRQYGFDSFLMEWEGANQPGSFLLVMPRLFNADGTRASLLEYEKLNIIYVMADRSVWISTIRLETDGADG